MKLRIKIDTEEDPSSPFPKDAAEKFEGKLEGVFGEELPLLCQSIQNYPEVEVSLSFLATADMKDVNKQYRGIDEPTDVLTFPLWEDFSAPLPIPFSMPGSQLSMPGAAQAFEVLPLGDIVICPEETEREHAPMTRREALCLVLAHGFLHLLGWDHDTPEKEELMWDRQALLKTKLLDALGEIF